MEVHRPLAPLLWLSSPPALSCICVLAERAGFVIAASLLFWCTARAFDDRHPVRDGIAALAISLTSYVLFARVLQLSLP